MAEEPRTEHIQLRVTKTGATWIDTTRERLGLNRTDLIRHALAYAALKENDFAKFVAARERKP